MDRSKGSTGVRGTTSGLVQRKKACLIACQSNTIIHHNMYYLSRPIHVHVWVGYMCSTCMYVCIMLLMYPEFLESLTV